MTGLRASAEAALQALLRLRAGLDRFKAWRHVLLPLALAALVAGMVWSVRGLGLGWSEIDWLSLGVVALLLVPSLWINAAELQLCARAIGQSMTLREALTASNMATIANLLPLPGAAIVRGAALARAGGSKTESGGIVLAAGLVWLALAVLITTLAVSRSVAALLIAGAALGCVAAILIWIARRSSAGIAAGFLLVRAGLLGLTVLRLYFCFHAVGATVNLREAAVYAVATIAGTVVGVVPAGLGVAEGVGAALAVLVNASPQAAFLSLSVDRIAAMICSGLVVAWFLRRAPKEGQD